MGISFASNRSLIWEVGVLAYKLEFAINGFELQTVIDQLIESQVAGVLADATQSDVPIIECNQAFIDLTGYSKPEIIGRNCRFLSRGHAGPAVRAKFRDAIAQGRPAIIEVLNFRKDGSSFLNGVTVAPISDRDGKIVAYLGSQVELGATMPTADHTFEHRESNPMGKLSSRQHEAVIYMASGMPIKQIACELRLSERTVKLHRTRAMRALGVDNRIDAVRIALETGF
ncbi:MAG: PAS domain-containing protein [Alphaproteobacteria bacterium]|nr:MAG: PAS domain-containing protein [Alphaproteobacteria bacterium]